MLETASVTTTVLKINNISDGTTSNDNTSILEDICNPCGNLKAIPSLSNMTSSMATGTLAAATLLPWECDSASKYSPIKLEPSPDSLDDIVLSQSASSDFAELKPLPYDYETTSLTGLDPVLTNNTSNNNNNTIISNNNNNKSVSDLNISSPGSSSGISGSSGPSVASRSSTTSSFSTSSSSSGIGSINSNLSSLHHLNNNGGQADVTSSGTNSPPSGATKLEGVDFTASKDAFDDLASIVGMSMGADSTVPSIEGTGDVTDLDWIENIKPLNMNGELTFDGISIPTVSANTSSTATAVSASAAVTLAGLTTNLSCNRINSIGNPVISATQPYLQMGLTANPSSTLQCLLQGNLQPQQRVQLQHRDGPQHLPQGPQLCQLPPPPYSILQNRLTHGPPTSIMPHLNSSHIIKVDSTFDLMKAANEAASAASSTTNGYLSGIMPQSYVDTLPHSTQSALNHVTTTDQSGLQRRLSDIGGLKSIKAKQKNRLPKLGLGGLPGACGDQNKKMMHHCQICHRGFLNKSNIKVHLRTHTGEKPFKCEHCSKAFRQKAHLLKHMSIHKRISRD